MKSLKLSCFFCLFVISISAQKKEVLILDGTIGKYPIVVKIETNQWETGEITGSYKYRGKEKSLRLKGQQYPPCLYMEEYVNGDTTGYFYLEQKAEGWSGYWSNLKKVLPVNLIVKSGDQGLLSMKSAEDFESEVNSNSTGTYENRLYFINDFWLDQNASVEIGFNGGNATIEILDEESIRFTVEVICGPTYHFAIAEGEAVKEGEGYVYRNEDGCEIRIQLSEKGVSLKANNSMDCSFGARAYLDHEFVKIKDEVVRPEDNR